MSTSEYLDHYNQLYHLLQCPNDLKIPLNDQQAWLQYQQYRDIYNCQKLAEFQNLYHAIMPIRPLTNQYPIVLRPITDLYETMDQYIIKNDHDFWKHWSSFGFWMKKFEPPHDSFEILIKNGKIKWHTCFRAYYLNHTSLIDYWEGLPYEKLPPIILKLISEFLSDFTGCLQVESMNKKIVSCHLRMKNLYRFPDKRILVEAIRLYQKKSWTLSYCPPKIYLFMIWCRKLIKNQLVMNEIIKICQTHQIDTYQKSNHQTSHRKRHLTLTCLDYKSGCQAKKEILETLKKFGYHAL